MESADTARWGLLGDLGAYPAMKDSGLNWLGQVPAHWAVRPAKFFLREIDERSTTGEEELLSVSHLTGVTQRREKNVTMFMAESNVGHKLCRPGDVVINTMWAWMAALGVTRQTGVVSPSYGVYRPRHDAQFSGPFLDLLLRTPAYRAEYQARSRGITDSRLRLYPDAFLRIPVLCPPQEEQAAIVRFLDHMNQRIHRYIRAKQKLVKLLEEQKQAIIHHAVIRGLDPNVRLKLSGVEWLGDVPEHWEVRRVHAVFRERKENGRPDLPILVVSIASGVTRGEEVDEDGRPKRLIPDKALYKVGHKGDIAYNMMRMWQGAVGVVPADGLVSPAYVVAAPHENVNAAYYAFLFRTDACKGEVVTRSRGIVDDRNRLYWDAFKDLRVPFPRPEEQDIIVQWIDDQTSHIERSIGRLRREVELIREYRTRLIADVVTGKLDVREAAERLPNEVEEPEGHDEVEAQIDAEEPESDELETAVEEAET